MKTRHCLFAILAIGLLAPVGCKKEEQSAGAPAVYSGVKVDVPKLDAEFAGANKEVQDWVTMIKRFFRYGQFAQAISALDQLSKTPNLTESQKKLVNTLIEQTQQVISKVPPKPAP